MLTPNPKINFPPSILKYYLKFLILLTFLFSSTGWTATDCSQVTQIPQIECEALLDFYNSTGGPSWVNDTGWNEDSISLCSWIGVSCENWHITKLEIPYDNLNGTIPESLGNLTQLSVLYLEENNLSGSIPGSLGNLTQLSELTLNENLLSGSIPESLGNLSQLNYLDLSYNQLSGPIPESLGNLNQLEYLFLFDNQLCGEIPNTLIPLDKIRNCILENNYLTVNPNSSDLITFLNQNCRNWEEQNQPTTNCIADQNYTLTFQTTGEGAITAPTGLDDGIQCPTNCNEDYLKDSTITLTAKAANDF
jgi:Leucine-rich repeat (LRR) protein